MSDVTCLTALASIRMLSAAHFCGSEPPARPCAGSMTEIPELHNSCSDAVGHNCSVTDPVELLQIGVEVTLNASANSGVLHNLGVQFTVQVAVVIGVLCLVEGIGSCCSAGRRGAQFVYLASSILNSAGFTILLMVSLPYTQSLGRSEVSSGLLVSSNAVGGFMAQMLAPFIVPDEADSTMTRIRRASSMTLCGQALAHTGFIFSAYQIANHGNLLWFSLLTFRILSGFFGALTNLTASLVALHMSPDSEILNLQTASQACRNLGLCVGGVLSSIALSAFEASGLQMDMRRLGTVPVMYLTGTVLFVLMANILFVPRSVPDLELEPHAEATPEEANPTNSSSQSPQKSSDPGSIENTEGPSRQDRQDQAKHIHWHCIMYNFERSFSTTAIEVASTLISEDEFGMKPVTTGYIFGIITVGSALLNLAVGFTRSDPTARSFIMLLSACGGIVFVVFLFDFWPFYFLYIGDTFLFTFSNTANGIVDGIATLSAVPGSEYSKKRYMNSKMIAMAIARIGAAPFTRGVIQLTNRNCYAALQLLLTILGFGSAYKIYKATEINFAKG